MSEKQRDLAVILLCVLGVFQTVMLLYHTGAIRRLRRLIKMSTAELLAVLQASDDATNEIATDLDALIALIGTQPNVDPEVADAANALLAKLNVNKDKFTPTP